MGKDKTYKMKKIKVCCRERISELFKIDQLYSVLTEDNDIHVNGSVEIIGSNYGNIKKIKVYANLCNKYGAILYVLNGWKNYPVSKGTYNSFVVGVIIFSFSAAINLVGSACPLGVVPGSFQATGQSAGVTATFYISHAAAKAYSIGSYDSTA